VDNMGAESVDCPMRSCVEKWRSSSISYRLAPYCGAG
jgi:hypothetical protein